jgi:hypothetical protein
LTENKEILTRAFLALLITNAAGYCLKFFKLDDYLILLGFRLKLCFILPALFFIGGGSLSLLKNTVLTSFKNKFLLQSVLFILPLIIFTGLFYLTGKIDLGDPEYFYEFGLSSIFDLPVYFIWNLPQLLCFVLIIKLIASSGGSKFSAMLFAVLIFSYRFIPVKGEAVNIPAIAGYLITAITAGLAAVFFRNPLAAAFSIFFMTWSYFLFWGTGSAEAIHILFASKYDTWEGLLWIDDKSAPFVVYAHTGISFIGFWFASLLYKKKE